MNVFARQLPWLALLSLTLSAGAAAVDGDAARRIAERRLQVACEAGLRIDTVEEVAGGLAQLVRLAPVGYVVVCGDERLPPVLAWSWNSEFGPLDASINPLLDLVQADLSSRLAHLDLLSAAQRRGRQEAWRRALSPGRDGERVTCWPEEGSTTTGGWIETRWGQGAPYNAFCPLGGAGGARSLAGCPSVVIAQILAGQRDTRGTRFLASDRYHHNYGGNNYWIDDDFEEFGFPSFPQLNARLDSLDARWQAGDEPTNADKAALVFACGVAATQVYHPQGSGTFGVNQAFAAWQRFGFDQARLLDDGDESVYEQLAQNMMDGLPAHLAVVTPAWDAGHNLVVDGYRSDGCFHLNFGWSGSYDGWYLVPSELPYELSVLEGVIVDIVPAAAGVESAATRGPGFSLRNWPNPCNPASTIAFELSAPGPVRLDVCNLLGQPVARVFDGVLGAGTHQLSWTPQVSSGVYFVRLRRMDTRQAEVRRVAVIH